MFASTLVASALLLSPSATASYASPKALAVRQQQDANTPLYLDEPSCDSYQCAITWKPGQNATANWLNAPDGNVILDLMTNASSVLAYNIGTVPGVTSNCDAGQGAGVAVSGVTCGSASWIVASEWIGGNFTLRASSQNQPNVESYTDVILVVADPSNTASVPFSLEGATATSSSTASAAGASSVSSSAASSVPSASGSGSASSASSSSSGSASATSAAPSSSSSAGSSGGTSILRSPSPVMIVASTVALVAFASLSIIL